MYRADLFESTRYRYTHSYLWVCSITGRIGEKEINFFEASNSEEDINTDKLK
jgi:hypothetical protein